MITIHDSIAGDCIEFNYVQNSRDATEALDFVRSNRMLALDTESTGLNCYHPEWQLRTFQFGNQNVSYVLPATARRSIHCAISSNVTWIGHNGPHDIRCLDVHLGFNTGVVCKGETYIPAHHHDPRKQEEGGTAHGLKEQAIAFIDPNAGKWETALKQEFKKINIDIPNEIYKSGPRKGQQKTRKAKLSEGWGLIDPRNLAYLAYAAADPILTYRLWRHYKSVFNEFRNLYNFDHQVQYVCDKLHRRGIKLDIGYTTRLREALDRKAKKFERMAKELNCPNIYSSAQVAYALQSLGAHLTELTPTGNIKADAAVLEHQFKYGNAKVRELVQIILTAKRLSKRREAYADAMLREMDAKGRIHPSINSLAARTARMSISNPALQQLPTKDEEN